jgi:hypothetical protein
LADLKRRSAIDRGSTLHAAAADGSCCNNSVPARFHRSPGEFAALVGEFSATACAESLGGTNERPSANAHAVATSRYRRRRRSNERPVNGRAAIFFRFFFHLFRRGFCLERPFTEGFRAFSPCGLLDFFRFGRHRPRPDRTPRTHLSRTLQASRYCNKMHGLWRRSLREFAVIVVLPPTRGRASVGRGCVQLALDIVKCRYTHAVWQPRKFSANRSLAIHLPGIPVPRNVHFFVALCRDDHRMRDYSVHTVTDIYLFIHLFTGVEVRCDTSRDWRLI